MKIKRLSGDGRYAEIVRKARAANVEIWAVRDNAWDAYNKAQAAIDDPKCNKTLAARDKTWLACLKARAFYDDAEGRCNAALISYCKALQEEEK